MPFELNQQLAADTLPLGTLALSSVRLMNDCRFPWVILVPRRAVIREITDLPRDEQIALLDEITFTSRALTELYAPGRINVAALGNVVPQLHVHVIARRPDDAAWPMPVWGAGTPVPYSVDEANEHTSRLKAALGIPV